MKNIFLTSEFFEVSEKVFKDIEKLYLKKESRGNIKKDKLRALFIETAAEESSLYSEWFLNNKKEMNKFFTVEDYTLTGKTQKDNEEKIKDFDIIYISGGNTFHLMEKVLESNFDQSLKKVLEEKIIIGQSAGSVMLGKSISLKSNPPQTSLTDFNGLNIYNATIIPHWGRKEAKKSKEALFKKMYNLKSDIILLRDKSYIFFDGKSFKIK